MSPQPPCLLFEGLSLNFMPSSAFPWIGLPGTRTQRWGADPNPPPCKNSGATVCLSLLHTLISIDCMFETVCLQNSLQMMSDEACRRFAEIFKAGCMISIGSRCLVPGFKNTLIGFTTALQNVYESEMMREGDVFKDVSHDDGTKPQGGEGGLFNLMMACRSFVCSLILLV